MVKLTNPRIAQLHTIEFIGYTFGYRHRSYSTRLRTRNEFTLHVREVGVADKLWNSVRVCECKYHLHLDKRRTELFSLNPFHRP